MDSFLLRRRMLLNDKRPSFLPFDVFKNETTIDPGLLDFFIKFIEREYPNNPSPRSNPFLIKRINNPYYYDGYSTSNWHDCITYIMDVYPNHSSEDPFVNRDYAAPWNYYTFQLDSTRQLDPANRHYTYTFMHGYIWHSVSIDGVPIGWGFDVGEGYSSYPLFGNHSYTYVQDDVSQPVGFEYNNNYPIYVSQDFYFKDSYNNIGLGITQSNNKLPYKIYNEQKLQYPLSTYQEVWLNSTYVQDYPTITNLNRTGVFAYNWTNDNLSFTNFLVPTTEQPQYRLSTLYTPYEEFDITQNSCKFFLDGYYILIIFRNRVGEEPICYGTQLPTDITLFGQNGYIPIFTTSNFEVSRQYKTIPDIETVFGQPTYDTNYIPSYPILT